MARFLLEVEGTSIDIDDEIDIEDRITEVMREVAEAASMIRNREPAPTDKETKKPEKNKQTEHTYENYTCGRQVKQREDHLHSFPHPPLLKEHGKTAVIKHLHSHYFEQAPPGKDTTTHYEHGADIVIGTDPEKAIAAIRNGSLHDMLNLLSDQGVEYTIIEGHKAESFQKVVIGDLEIEGCVLRNPPRPEDVLTHISEFSEVYTLQGLVQELKRDHMSDDTGCIAAFNGIVRKVTGTEITETMDFTDTETIHTLSEDIRKGMEQIPGVLGVRFHHQTGIIPAGDDLTYIAVIARHRPEAFAALMQGIDRMKHELHDVGKTLEGEYHGNA